MAGYTRQDTTGQLANGNPIDADIFNDEYDAIEGAFNASTGHTHDGTAGGGAPIESIGPSQELEVTSAAAFPKNDNLIDHGKSTLRWKTGYYGTDVIVGQDVTVTRDVSVGRNLTVTGDTTVNGNTTLGDTATDTVVFNADVDSNIKPETTGTYDLGSSTQEWNNLWLDGMANVDNLTVDEDAAITGTLDVTGAVGIDGDFDINTNKVTIVAATGNTLIAGTLSVADVVYVTDTTGSTNTNTGAVVVSGGAGIAENIYVGGNADITGTLNVTGDATLVNMTATGTADITGAMGVEGNFDVGTTQFTVDASNGNTVIAGTLDVTGDTTVENLTVNGNTVLGDAITDTVTVNTNATTHSIIPATASTYDLGDSSTYWQHGYIDAITTTGNVGVGGDVTITGDLTVSGTTTTVNSTTVDIADLNITVASGAANAAAANGGGMTVAGADATLTYDSTTDRWDMNKDLEVANVYGDLTGDVKASDGTVVLDAGTGSDAAFTGSVDGVVGGTTPAAVTGTTIQFNTGLTDGTTTITGFADEDDMTSDSATLIPTQQSVKAYVDAAVAGDGSGDIAVDTVDASTVDLGGGAGAGWVIEQSGTELHFIYNGAVQAKLTSTGTLQVNDDVAAEAF